MSKPEYCVYSCDADNDSPDTRVTFVTTKSLEEAQRIFEKESMHGVFDTKYVLKRLQEETLLYLSPRL